MPDVLGYRAKMGVLGPSIGWRLHPEAVNQALPTGYGAAGSMGAVGLIVILRAFANGCSAMTGTCPASMWGVGVCVEGGSMHSW